MLPERRAAIAEIIRKHDAYVIEDDVYAFLFAAPLPPITTLIPERAFYVTSFAKCLAPGLRIGAMIVPDCALLSDLLPPDGRPYGVTRPFAGLQQRATPRGRMLAKH